jgi:serine protease Do
MLRRWSIPLVCLVVGGLSGSFVAGPMLLGQNATSPAVPKEITSYRDVVKKVLPAVVSIEGKVKANKTKTDQQSPRRRSRPDDPFIPEEFRKFFDEMEKRQLDPDEIPALGLGSGFVVDPKGVILTNYHVVAGADQVEVQLKDGRKFTSRDIKGDRKTDLAIVKIDAKGQLPYLELGDSDAMEIGDRVLAVGAPFGLTGSVTAGIVSSKGRNKLNVNMYEDFIQTDAAINPGNSGGPLVNLEGKVIGINSAIKSRTGGFQGVGLAIASNLAQKIMQSLLKDGVVHRGYLGIQMTELTPELASRLDLKDQHGIIVGMVYDGSPAAKAGLQEGDVVTGLAGKPLKDGLELQKQVLDLPLGKPVALNVVRDGKLKNLQVTIEEQPGDFGYARASRIRPPRGEKEDVTLDKLGVTVKDLTPELAQQMGYKGTANGALIARVEPGSPAAEAGLGRGMLITRVDKQPVDSATAFQEKVAKGSLEKGLLLQVHSPQGGTSYVIVKSTTEN